MGCKKSHIRDPKSMLGSGVTPPKKRLCCCFCHIFVKDYSNFPNIFSCCWKLRASYRFEEIPLKSSLQKHNAKKAMAAMDVYLYIAGFSWPLFKMRSLEARFWVETRLFWGEVG